MAQKADPGVARFAGLVTTLACVVMTSACSSAGGTSSVVAMRQRVVSRPIPGVSVGLTPTLAGGYAGWCIAMTTTTRNGSGSICSGTRTWTGPIVLESCSEIVSPKVFAAARVVVLTKGDVAAVRVAGGTPIPTESASALPGGLRAAAIELPGYKIDRTGFTVGYPWLPCPRVAAFDARDKLIADQGASGSLLDVPLPGRYWRPPARPPSGVCRLAATRLPRDTVLIEGTVATRVRPLPGLIGQAFIACTDTTYFYKDNHDIPAAVLLGATHPDAEPPDLPGMKPLAGHPSVFEAPPDMFARRIRGAWLVVEEEDNIGPRVPVELLEHLRATIHL
jgi:hypothetical protein